MSTILDSNAEDVILEPILAQVDQPDAIATAGRELQHKLLNEINIALSRRPDAKTTEIAQTILHDFVRLFGRLTLIESNLQRLDTMLENLSLLELVQFEVRSLLDFIDATIRAEAISDKMREVLDGISYGISHDVKKIFERELLGCGSGTVPVVYGKLLHAHGLLANCFQQSTISLLQVLNPNFEALTLFNDSEQRLRQSLALCEDLSSLTRTVQQAETLPTPDVLGVLVERIMEFRDSSMQYLMYRDWRQFERLALEVITAVDNDREAKALIHQFGCYLEVLYGHVKMRAVLRDTFSRSGADSQEE